MFQLRPWRWRFGVRIWRSTTYASSSRTHSGNAHILLTYVFHRWRTYSTDVRLPPSYVFSWRTWSDDVRILWLRVPVPYASSWRTDSGDVCVFCRRTSSTVVRVLSTYVFYRRTYSTDVRALSTYVCYRTYVIPWRTYLVLRSGDLDSGLRFWSDGFGTTQSRIEDSGLRRTFWIWWRRSPWTRFQALA